VALHFRHFSYRSYLWGGVTILMVAAVIGTSQLVQQKQDIREKAAVPATKTVEKIPADYVNKIPLNTGGPIYGLKLSGKVNLNNPNSFVRAVLVDSKDNEYLVYEAYPLLVDSNNFTISNACEETCILDGVVPKYLRLEGNSSLLTIDKTTYVGNPGNLSKTGAFVAEQQKIKNQKENYSEKRTGHCLIIYRICRGLSITRGEYLKWV